MPGTGVQIGWNAQEDAKYAQTRARQRLFAFTAHRGVNLLAASTLIAELGDLTRFDEPRTLMAFVGLVPSLTASGLERRTGRITKVNPYQCAHRPSHVGRPPMEFVHRTAVWLAAGHRTS